MAVIIINHSPTNSKETTIDQSNKTSSKLESSQQITDINLYHDNSAKFNLNYEIQCEFDWSLQNVTIDQGEVEGLRPFDIRH